MNVPLRRKYRIHDRVMGYPAKARTGNSHGPAKTRKKTGRPNQGPQRVLLVFAGTGKRRIVLEEAA